jgi:hypothetical protein
MIEKHLIVQKAVANGIHERTAWNRIKAGWKPEDVVTRPSRKRDQAEDVPDEH